MSKNKRIKEALVFNAVLIAIMIYVIVEYIIKLIDWLKYKWLKHKRKSVWDL